ncbi:hypothetical protein [Brucella pseudogrignonensis]|uniref:hypothetical protein n=1 Tax=Brucella pseudogrignonensis TaxID=419475 RepID=UPI0038D0CD47
MFKFIPKWSTLRGAGNSRFSRLTVLTPVFGYIILYLDFFRGISSLLFMESDAPANFWESAPILMIYFGLCTFSVGVVIYQMLCSDIVKRYDSHISYVLAVRTSLSKFECEVILQKIIASTSTSDGARSRAEHLSKSINLAVDVKDDNKIFVLTQHYHALNVENVMGRLISSVFIASGSVLIFLPTFITFVSIVKSLIR